MDQGKEGNGEEVLWEEKHSTDGRKLGRRYENEPYSDTVQAGREEEGEPGSSSGQLDL